MDTIPRKGKWVDSKLCMCKETEFKTEKKILEFHFIVLPQLINCAYLSRVGTNKMRPLRTIFTEYLYSTV